VPVSVRVQLDGLTAVMSTLEVLPGAVDIEAERALLVSTFIVEGEVKALTPRKTGRLFAAWESSLRSPTVGMVANNVDYARFVEEGAGPHDIWAKPGSALFWPGARHPVKHVFHPGFVGRRMAALGLRAAIPAVVEEFKRALRGAIRIALGKP
jgi:hypothetical protein